MLVPNIQSPVDLKSYVTVMGEVVKFDPAEVAKKAKDYKIDLPPDAAAKYTGRPAVIATSVINDKFIDVAKRLPPPMNAEEEAFSKVMKQVAPAFAALRAGIDWSERRERHQERGGAEAGVHRHRDVLQAEEAGRDAVGGRGAQARRDDPGGGRRGQVGRGEDDGRDAAAVVRQCHGQYRERFDDGSFRYKPGN